MRTGGSAQVVRRWNCPFQSTITHLIGIRARSRSAQRTGYHKQMKQCSSHVPPGHACTQTWHLVVTGQRQERRGGHRIALGLEAVGTARTQEECMGRQCKGVQRWIAM